MHGDPDEEHTPNNETAEATSEYKAEDGQAEQQAAAEHDEVEEGEVTSAHDAGDAKEQPQSIDPLSDHEAEAAKEESVKDAGDVVVEIEDNDDDLLFPVWCNAYYHVWRTEDAFYFVRLLRRPSPVRRLWSLRPLRRQFVCDVLHHLSASSLFPLQPPLQSRSRSCSTVDWIRLQIRPRPSRSRLLPEWRQAVLFVLVMQSHAAFASCRVPAGRSY